MFFFKATEYRGSVKVETLLLQIGHKKRKDVSSPIMQVSKSVHNNIFWGQNLTFKKSNRLVWVPQKCV